MRDREYRHHRQVSRMLSFNHVVMMIVAAVVVVTLATSYGVLLHQIFAAVTDTIQHAIHAAPG